MKKSLQENPLKNNSEGFVLIDKSSGSTSFQLVKKLRYITQQKKVGHAGTLDPLATGLMILLLGKPYTKLSQKFMEMEKVYLATIKLGVVTDTYDAEGKILSTSDYIPTLDEIEKALLSFQGTINQIPPMYSAKKVGGKKLYDLARKNISITREPSQITVETKITSYEYPYLKLFITCSSGTYVRSIAHDLGQKVSCGAMLEQLSRERIGPFFIQDAIKEEELEKRPLPIRRSIPLCK